MAASHVEATSTIAGATAEAASNKKTKYSALQKTQFFVPVSLETMGSWNVQLMFLSIV